MMQRGWCGHKACVRGLKNSQDRAKLAKIGQLRGTSFFSNHEGFIVNNNACNKKDAPY